MVVAVMSDSVRKGLNFKIAAVILARAGRGRTRSRWCSAALYVAAHLTSIKLKLPYLWSDISGGNVKGNVAIVALNFSLCCGLQRVAEFKGLFYRFIL